MTIDARDETPEAYLRSAGVRYTVHGREARIACPSCGSDEGCDIHLVTGLWSCLRASCAAKGNLWQLKRARGDMYEVREVRTPAVRPLPPSPDRPRPEPEMWAHDLALAEAAAEARRYLHEIRRITPQTAVIAGLGWRPGRPVTSTASAQTYVPSHLRTAPDAPPPPGGPGSHGQIMIPYRRTPTCDVTLWKVRHVPPEPLDAKGRPIRFSRVAGGETSLYLPMGLPAAGQGVMLVGGELDALSVVQALCEGGLGPETWADPARVPMVVAGVPSGEGAWSESCDRDLAGVEDIVIALDSDPAGQAGTAKRVDHLGRHRCRVASWRPHKDANAALQASDLDAGHVLTMWRSAEPASVTGVISVGDMKDRLRQSRHSRQRVMSTGVLTLDAMIGGLRDGEITAVTGQTGAGKSTLCSQVALEVARQGRRVLMCPFELGAVDQTAKWLRQSTGREPTEMPDAELDAAVDALPDLLIFDWYGPVDLSKFRETLLYAIRRLGVGLIVVDHLHFCVSRDSDETYYAGLDRMIRMLQGVILTSPAHMLVVMQPGKTGDGKSRDDHIVQLGDIKGGASLTQDVANGLSLYRRRDPTRKSSSKSGAWEGRDVWVEAGIVSLKQRDRRGSEGHIVARYNTISETFHDSTDAPGGVVHPSRSGQEDLPF